jgi:hypothetical protein
MNRTEPNRVSRPSVWAGLKSKTHSVLTSVGRPTVTVRITAEWQGAGPTSGLRVRFIWSGTRVLDRTCNPKPKPEVQAEPNRTTSVDTPQRPPACAGLESYSKRNISSYMYYSIRNKNKQISICITTKESPETQAQTLKPTKRFPIDHALGSAGVSQTERAPSVQTGLRASFLYLAK